MILGIAFLGEERRPLGSTLRIWTSHLLGGALGGAGAALVVWLLLTPVRTLFPSPIVVSGLAAFMLLAAWMDATGKRLWHSGLVPNTWPHRYGEVRGWALLGVVLGSGLGSHVVTALVYTTFLLAALTLPLGKAIGVGMLLGFTRTLVPGPASLFPARAGRWAYLSGRGPRFTARVGTLVSLIGSISLLLRLTHS